MDSLINFTVHNLTTHILTTENLSIHQTHELSLAAIHLPLSQSSFIHYLHSSQHHLLKTHSKQNSKFIKRISLKFNGKMSQFMRALGVLKRCVRDVV